MKFGLKFSGCWKRIFGLDDDNGDDSFDDSEFSYIKCIRY